ncbi:hypothetical protein NBC122_02413 [Chryseobacterium salivictor]|uniref:Uncharacterized protein n=1 Tax=Chryseobacterium salivictor TaxID=2547600 RepID=A0A4P6ZI56_9FLAO|nr:hypothetical protein NBC122_02413 [Chryseobacterium salivictor]
MLENRLNGRTKDIMKIYKISYNLHYVKLYLFIELDYDISESLFK